MDAEEIKKRTKQFDVDVGRLTLLLEKNDINRNNSNQISGLAVLLELTIVLQEEPNQKLIL